MSETLYYGNKNIAGLSNVTASAFYGTFVGSASQLTGIPTGPTGPQGTTGPTGITGPTGFTGPGYGPYQTAVGTSISPIVGGSVIVTLLTNLQSAFFVNQTVRVAINTSTYFDGIITNIAGLAYTIQVDFTTTASATGQWTFGLSGQRGAIGWTGPTGPAPTGSAGGVVYLTASQLSAATLPADLFWNNSNGRLGVKQASPAYTLDVTGNARITTDLTLGTALSVANGGTGVTTQQGAINVIAGAVTSGSFLRGDGTNVTMSTIQNGDLPATISRTNIAGTTSVVGPIVGSNTIAATTVTASGSIIGTHVGPIIGSNAFAGTSVTASGTISGNPLVGQLVGSNTIAGTTLTLTTAVSIGNGGTGQTTKAAAFDALSPMSAQGDIIVGGASGTGTRLAIGTSAQVLHGGTTPSYSAVSLAADVSGILPIANGGTGAITAQAAINALVGTQTNNRVLRSNGTDMSLAQVGLTTDVSGTLPVANGGTGQITLQAAINALAGTPANNRVLRSNGTDVTLSQVGLTTDVTGTLPILNGGTGQSTRQAALDALAGATTTNRFLRGDGTNILLAQVTLSGSDVTGTLPVANGGTGQTSVSQNTVFAGPGGAAGAPTFRTLVSGDIPNNAANTSGSAASATNASFATNATFASSSTNATFASSATNASAATNATFASSATNATFASSSTNATFASSATNASAATNATNLSGGSVSAVSTIQTSFSQGTNAPNTGQAYFYNPSNSGSQDSSCAVRLAGSNARYAYFSYDISGVAGYSHGILGSNQNLVFRASWDMSSGTIFTMDRSGNFTASADVTAYSDKRIKKDFKKIEGALDKVAKINGYTFTRTDEVAKDQKQAGVIAQEILEVLPEVVKINEETGYYTVAYGNLTALLIEAVKEERSKREALEVRLERLEKLLEQK
jgi:hypothetical protein